MRYFGISGIRLTQGTEGIEGLRVHSINEQTGDFLPDEFEWLTESKVKTCINRGDHVFIIRFDTAGKCERGLNVGTMGDKNETLYTLTAGRTWDTLNQLPLIN